MSKVSAVRKEFGESFRDVVYGFAIMGYSKKATSEILEINRSYFYQHLLPRLAPDAPWKKQKDTRDECKPKGKGWSRGRAKPQKKKYSDEYLLFLVLKYPSFTDFRERATPDISTVIKRFGSWRQAKRLALLHKERSGL